LKFIPIPVKEVIRETQDAVTICFETPEEGFKYTPGQYLTLKVNIQGKNYNRAYSLSSAIGYDKDLKVTVKVTPGGLVSNYLNEHLHQGTVIEVLPPLGHFTAKIDASHKLHYVLIGAGSGITPLMSIAKSVLMHEQDSKVTLLYGNRNEDGIIFHKQLEEFKSIFGNRINVLYALSQPKRFWEGIVGRLDKNQVKGIVSDLDFSGLKPQFYVCGPSGMMAEAVKALEELNYPKEFIFQEHFSAPIEQEGDKPMKVQENEDKIITRTIRLKYDGREKVVQVNPNMSVLDAALDNDLDPPYACMMGSCCTCKAKLVSGRVIMDDREGLTDDEINNGYVLTCQSHPLTDDVFLDYDA